MMVEEVVVDMVEVVEAIEEGKEEILVRGEKGSGFFFFLVKLGSLKLFDTIENR